MRFKCTVSDWTLLLLPLGSVRPLDRAIVNDASHVPRAADIQRNITCHFTVRLHAHFVFQLEFFAVLRDGDGRTGPALVGFWLATVSAAQIGRGWLSRNRKGRRGQNEKSRSRQKMDSHRFLLS